MLFSWQHKRQDTAQCLLSASRIRLLQHLSGRGRRGLVRLDRRPGDIGRSPAAKMIHSTTPNHKGGDSTLFRLFTDQYPPWEHAYSIWEASSDYLETFPPPWRPPGCQLTILYATDAFGVENQVSWIGSFSAPPARFPLFIAHERNNV